MGFLLSCYFNTEFKKTKKDDYNGWFKISYWNGCICHLLHLVVSCGLKGTILSQSLDKARSLSTKFVRNASLRNDIQSLADKVLIHALSNRWFYQVFEVERIIEVKT